jgi:hypothetical protein
MGDTQLAVMEYLTEMVSAEPMTPFRPRVLPRYFRLHNASPLFASNIHLCGAELQLITEIIRYVVTCRW